MPIKIQDDLPAARALRRRCRGDVQDRRGASDIRPLRVDLLNLMPSKISTETEVVRLLGASPLQVELLLVRMTDHVARNTPAEHKLAFYRT